MEYCSKEDVEARAIREFSEYTSEVAIRAAFSICGNSKLNSLYSVREMLIKHGVEGIPFITFRKDNDPGEMKS